MTLIKPVPQEVSDLITKQFHYDPINGTVFRTIGKRTRIIKGWKQSLGYLTYDIEVNGIRHRYLLHRLIWFIHFSYWPTELDHINQDKHDNSLANLREVSRSANMSNRGKSKKKTASKFLGVRTYAKSSHPKGKEWGSTITKEKKTYFLGYFATDLEAARAYDRKSKELFGSYAVLNFPKKDK